MIDVNLTKEEFLIKNDIKDGTIILDDWDVYKFAIIGITDDKQHIIYSHDKIIECLAKEMQKEYFKNTVLRLLLNGESHSKERVKAMKYNCELVSETEKQRVARDVLCLLYSIDSNHLEFVLSKDASRQIESWLKEIEGI